MSRLPCYQKILPILHNRYIKEHPDYPAGGVLRNSKTREEFAVEQLKGSLRFLLLRANVDETCVVSQWL